MIGVLYGGDGHQLGVQILGVLVIAVWSCTLSYIIFQILKFLCILRVPQDEEITGLDISHHGGAPRFALDIQKGVSTLQSISTSGTKTN